MSQDTCTFSYVRLRDAKPVTARGIESTWMDLKIQFACEGEGLAGAKYYKRISPEGPQLFAVKLDQTVWYYDDNKWHMYKSATDVKYDVFHSADMNPTTNTFASTRDEDAEPQFGEQDGSYSERG